MGTQLPQLPPLFQNPYGPVGTPPDPRHLIHYATDGVQPPSTVYLDQNDAFKLQIITWDSALNITLGYRILKANGEILIGEERVVTTNSVGSFITFTFPLTEGFLLSAQLRQAFGGGTQARGMTRARLWTVRGLGSGSSNLQQTNLLFQGGLDELSELAWPGSFIEPTASGQGWIRSVVGTTPGAGAEVTETSPGGTRWELRSIQFQLTTSATVATRGVALIIDDGVNALYAIEAPSTQAASLVQQYTWAPIGARADKVFGTNIASPIPAGIKMTSASAASFRFRTLTNNLQVGDQYTSPKYEVEQWSV